VWPRPDAANPYLARLVGSLRARGVDVGAAPRLALLCALPRGARWLHLHWPEWMIHHPDRRLYRARTAWLMGLLDLARARGLSLAWTAHNRVGHDDPHPDLGLAARRALLSRCAVVFGHFPGAHAALSALGFTGRFVLQPHPHAADDYPDPFASPRARLGFRRSLGLPDDALLLVSPGSMEPYKRLPLVARALRALPGHRLLWIPVGRAPAAELAALQAAAGDDARLRPRPGFASRASLASLVAAADATLLAHHDLFTSGSAVLSLSLGTPVIGPPEQHLATFAGHDYFLPWTPPDAAPLGAQLDRLYGLAPSVRDAARAAAMAHTWDGAAATVDEALFGAAA
jgi:glycosyltransferase involved in cell wall biosynthesis